LSVQQVMKNGRLYDASTLAEIWPRQIERKRPWFWDDIPVPLDENGLKPVKEDLR
jgi:hypothetical protein